MSDPIAAGGLAALYAGRTVAVLGLARSGLAAAARLTAIGARVLAWDDAPAARARALEISGVRLHDLAAEPDPGAWAALVMSPGIPLTHPAPHPVALKARLAGVSVIGDIEILWQDLDRCAAPGLIGITGTNGKSTTTALVGHILAVAGIDCAVGGNLGVPVLTLPRLRPAGYYVLEMSSFQLDLIDRTRFSIAVLLNLSPDHLDRHGDMAGYVAAKRRLFRNRQPGDLAIVGIDDDLSRAEAEALERAGAEIFRISAEAPVAGGVGCDRDGMLYDGLQGAPRPVLDLRRIPTLPGRHNRQNVAAAWAVARSVGVAPDAAAKAIAAYPGLAHRQEIVGRIGNVTFVNDSKATNADSAAKALVCYDRIYWICGGKPKTGGIDSLLPLPAGVERVYLIGEAAPAFAAALEGHVPVSVAGTLELAVAAAARDAAGSGQPSTVLLSPACASYDQFRDFEARGDAFRVLVRDLQSQAA